VLFAFDDHSIAFTTGLKLELVSGKEPGQRNPIVLGRGSKGEPDDCSVRYYGAVAEVDGELRMWYEAQGSLDRAGGRRICYATSDDGEHWEKANLGLVEYGGSRDNNIVDLFDGDPVIGAAPVIYDPEDPDPGRRFKMCIESGRFANQLTVAFSADGLRWNVPDFNPVGPPLEMAGLVKWGGCYYVNGQDEFGWHGSQWGAARKLVTFASYDFVNWTQASALGFRRDNVPPRPMCYDWNTAEEVHLGTCAWNRGNVIVGVYGMWHGTPTGDRRSITMDLGLLVSQDALHYREPVPDFRLIPGREEAGAEPGQSPCLMQGQGMINRGDHTLFWYELWAGSDVRLARWERDRLGYLHVFRERQLVELPPPQLLTCALSPSGGSRVALNVSGQSAHAKLRIELVDEHFLPIAGFSGDQGVVLSENGIDQPVVWASGEQIPVNVGTYRIKATFQGLRTEDVRLYAIYVRGV
jgi:hypothetical protein